MHPKDTAATIAASYERVSRLIQARHGFSLSAQHTSMEEFAAANNWSLPEHLRFRDGEEQDASGADWDLPALTAMLDAARHAAFSVLIVPDLDRFARSLVKGLVLEEQLRKYGVRVVYQRVPVEDSPEGRLLKTQLFAFAEYDREKIRLRTMTGIREKAISGRVVGKGPAPYGYRYTYESLTHEKRRVCGLELDPVAAPIMRRMFDDLLTSAGQQVANTYNDEGLANAGGRPWLQKTIYARAADPVYFGVWVYGKNGRKVLPGDGIDVPVPAIVSRVQWERVQEIITHRTRGPQARTPKEQDPYLLRGMLTCGHCHGGLHAVIINNVRYYRCSGAHASTARQAGRPQCVLPMVNARAVEAELWARINDTMLDERNLNARIRLAREQHTEAGHLRQDRLAAIDAEIAKQGKRLDAFASRLGDLGNGPLFEAVLRQAKETEELIARFGREREGLAHVHPDGLSEQQADSILAFVEDVREGLKDDSPTMRRRICEILGVAGRVRRSGAEGALRLGLKHDFSIEWRTIIGLFSSGTGSLEHVLLLNTSRNVPGAVVL